MRTKAWWSLCRRMFDWSNYRVSIKLPNVEMATFECKKTSRSNATLRSFVSSYDECIDRDDSVSPASSRKNEHSMSISQCVSHSLKVWPILLVLSMTTSVLQFSFYSYEDDEACIDVCVCVCHYSSPLSHASAESTFHVYVWSNCIRSIYTYIHTNLMNCSSNLSMYSSGIVLKRQKKERRMSCFSFSFHRLTRWAFCISMYWVSEWAAATKKLINSDCPQLFTYESCQWSWRER